MDAAFSKLWASAGGGVLGAIAGGCTAYWRVTAASAAAASNTDPTAIQPPSQALGAIAAVIKGVFAGGIIGVVLVVIVLALLSVEWVRPEREVDGGE